MSDDARAAIRAARRSDLHALTDLRLQFLGEAAHADTRLRLMPDARQRTEQALPVWMGQTDRVLLVALDPALSHGDGPGADDAPAVGYAMGLLGNVPPVLLHQHVGEILEVHVAPEHRGRGYGTRVTAHLCRQLVPHADPIGLNVKADNEAAIRCYRNLGFKSHAIYGEYMVEAEG